MGITFIFARYHLYLAGDRSSADAHSHSITAATELGCLIPTHGLFSGVSWPYPVNEFTPKHYTEPVMRNRPN